MNPSPQWHALLAALLEHPLGLRLCDLAREAGLTPGQAQHALSALTLNVPAVYEYTMPGELYPRYCLDQETLSEWKRERSRT